MTQDEIKYIEEEVDKILHRGVVPYEEGRLATLTKKLDSLTHEELKNLFWLEQIIQQKVSEFHENNYRKNIDSFEERITIANSEIENLEKSLQNEKNKENSNFNFKKLEAEYNMNLVKLSEKTITTKVVWFILGALGMFLFK